MDNSSESAQLILDCAQLDAGSTDTIVVCQQLVLDNATVATTHILNGLVTVDLTVNATTAKKLVAIGNVHGTWIAECRRCLDKMEGQLEVPIREVFEDTPIEGETWPISMSRINLGPPVREAVLLSLPLTPLCSTTCAGPVPNRFPTGPATSNEPASNKHDLKAVQSTDKQPKNPTWDALNQIRFE
ncbi:MAG: DUF177 domain-containing protein [Acidimicrobiaceae bacterium]|nr:DUF177 domain-containing protein [Acidimicrobiaceae bacterium]